MDNIKGYLHIIEKPESQFFRKLLAKKENCFEKYDYKTNWFMEIAEETHYSINQSIIDEEAKYDGLYAVCTNLEDDVQDIIKINHKRLEIEESFRIMKSEFNARPVFHSNEDAIKAHFLICFLALTIYRYLEKKLDEKYTVGEIIDSLKEMDLSVKDGDYIPNYTRTNLTDDLHEKFGFRTDFEILTEKNLKKIIKNTKI